MLPLLLLALLQDPSIESVRTLTGGVARSGCWLPVEAVVKGPFHGDVVVATDLGVRFVRVADIPAGAAQRLILPALVLMPGAAVTVTLGGDRALATRTLDPPLTFCPPNDLIVGVVAGDARTVDLGEGRKAWCVPWIAADWSDPALLEGFDVIAGDPGRAPLSLFRAQGGVVLPGPFSEAAIKALPRVPVARFESVDELVQALGERDAWIEGKREMALRLMAFNVAVFFAAFSWVILKRPTLAWLAGMVALAVAVTTLLALLFPRAWTFIRIRTAQAEGVELRLKTIRRDGRKGDPISLGGLAKPLFGTIDEARRADLELRDDSGRFSVRSAAETLFMLEAVEAPVLGGIRTRRQSEAVILSSDVAALRLQVLMASRNSGPVEVRPGNPAVVTVTTDEPAPDDADFRYFARRLVRGDCAFGWMMGEDAVEQAITASGGVGFRSRQPFVIIAIK